MRCSAAFALTALLLAGSAVAETLPLRVGPHAFHGEVASTPAARARGLMGRTHLAADAAMLFVFEAPGRHCFWMRDTPLPLSIAFVDGSGRIVALADMAPRSEARHCPPVDIRYALEVRQGEFQRRGIRAGTTIDGLPR
jgi:uncharacterized membrane protein (UPF0127 family)